VDIGGFKKCVRDLQMSSKDLMVQIAGLSKCYTIYNQPIDRLKQSIVPKILGALGKPAKTYYREFWALQDVSLEVGKGETIGIIGRNGSGKSTLLQLICGTLTPTTGKVETRGRITALLELGSGFNPEFSGRENVFLNGAILGLSQEEIETRFDDIVGFADIGNFIEQPVKFYSSGMAVRLAFAIQAMVDPDILIVDEALAVGDERFQRKCFRRLEELKSNGTTILFVSHASQQIIELCDRAVLLEQGQRLLSGDPLIVVRAYQKLIYADLDNQARLIEEFQKMDLNGATSVQTSAVTSLDENTPLWPVSQENKTEADFYESNMIPQSTEIMPVMGAKINSIQIFNSNGKEVNNLLTGKEYNFQIRGVFLEDREAVRFGLHIRTKTGLTIAGIGYPKSGTFFTNVKKGQRYKLTFKIKMNLAPDTYFVGSGVWSSREPIRLYQVLDLIMFRVLPRPENLAFGYVDLVTDSPSFEISEEQ
jgi:lipopolysaccharide transport system ATP-binding protein